MQGQKFVGFRKNNRIIQDQPRNGRKLGWVKDESQTHVEKAEKG